MFLTDYDIKESRPRAAPPSNALREAAMQTTNSAMTVLPFADATTTILDLPRLGQRNGSVVLDTFIDAVNWEGATSAIIHWGQTRQSRSIYFCNVHSLV